MPTFNKPELHAPALALIGLVARGGPIAMSAFAALLAGALPADQTQQLAAGQITLDTAGKTFIGHEPQEAIKEGNLTIKIPAQVGGSYISSPWGCTFTFDKSETVAAQEHIAFFTLGAKLISVRVDERTIQLGFDKSEANTTITHG